MKTIKKTSLYLVAALAATTTIGKAHANYLDEDLGISIVIDHDELNKMNDQDCQKYVTRKVRAALPKQDRETLRKVRQANAMLEGYKARQKALDESLRTKTGYRADSKEYEKLWRDANMLLTKLEIYANFYVGGMTGGLGMGLAVANSSRVFYEGIKRDRELKSGALNLRDEVDLKNREISALITKYQKILDRHEPAAKEINSDTDPKVKAAVSRYCGEGQAIKTVSALDLGVDLKNFRWDPKNFQIPEKGPFLRPRRAGDRPAFSQPRRIPNGPAFSQPHRIPNRKAPPRVSRGGPRCHAREIARPAGSTLPYC